MTESFINAVLWDIPASHCTSWNRLSIVEVVGGFCRLSRIEENLIEGRPPEQLIVRAILLDGQGELSLEAVAFDCDSIDRADVLFTEG